MKGYKGFNKGLVCRGKQYAENTVFEEDKAVVCEKGMHFCENPLDVLDYYPILNNNAEPNEFCEVEALDEPLTDDNKKFVTKKLKIGAKLSFSAFVKAAIDFVFEKTQEDKSSGDYAQLASSGNYAKLASSGYYAKLASSGNYAKLASSGDYAQLASSGYCAKLASSGDSAQLASSGYCAQLASSGDYAKLASSGDYAKLASSGDSAKLASSGDSAQLASSGDSAQLASSGDYAKLASSGDYAQLASSGDYAQLASSGYCAKLASSGKKSVVCGIGYNNIAKAARGSWITLAEYDNDGRVVFVKTEYVDGKKIKADTWYKLKNEEFVEV